MQQDHFNFWVPLEIVKAAEADSDGTKKMQLQGIASTKDIDTDGESLESDGFDLTYFNKSGFVNWHHGAKGNPDCIIGEPVKAEKRKEGLWVKVDLYDKPLAKQVYDLADLLERQSKTRRLGFSIEGKATERDPNNPKRILKAKITGLAVTHMPKNNKTLAEIVKGEVDFEPLSWDDEDVVINFYEVKKASENTAKNPSGDTYSDYPKSAKEAAKTALKWCKDYPSEISKVSDEVLRLANVIASGANPTKEDALYIYEQLLDKSTPDKVEKPWKTKQYLINMLLGGNDMLVWLQDKLSDIEKTLSTDGARPLLPEDVEGLKNLQKNKTVAQDFGNSDIENTSSKSKDKDNFSNTKNIQNKMAKKLVSQDELEKSLQFLGINSDITKGDGSEDDDDDDNEDHSDDLNFNDGDNDPEDDEDEDEEEGEDEDEKKNSKNSDKDDMNKAIGDAPAGDGSYYKSFDKGATFRKMCKSDTGKDKFVDEEDYIKKGGKYLPAADMEEGDGLSKALSSVKNSLQDIQKSLQGNTSENIELFKAMGNVMKNMADEVKLLRATVAELNSQLEEQCNQPTNIRKSLSNQRLVNERFPEIPNLNTLGTKQDRNKILALLDQKTFEKGNIDEGFSKAMTKYESTGFIDPTTIMRLQQIGIQIQEE